MSPHMPSRAHQRQSAITFVRMWFAWWAALLLALAAPAQAAVTAGTIDFGTAYTGSGIVPVATFQGISFADAGSEKGWIYTNDTTCNGTPAACTPDQALPNDGSNTTPATGWFRSVDGDTFNVSRLNIRTYGSNTNTQVTVTAYRGGVQQSATIFRFQDLSAVGGGACNSAGFCVLPVNLTRVDRVSIASDVDWFWEIDDVVVAPYVPQVASLSPASGSGAGGNTVTITGSQYADVPATGAVKFGAATASYNVVNDTTITATAPAGSGVVDVTVASPQGASATSASTKYAYVPTVTGISPSFGLMAGGTTVTITGAGLLNATGVAFGGTAAGFTVNGATQITATAPAVGAEGVVDVRVTTAGGTSVTSAADQYTYLGAPTITSLSPTAGPTAGNGTVVITGTGFAAAAATGAVSFDGTAASYIINGNTQITATAPAHAAGTAGVTVTNAVGTSAAATYTYGDPPAASAVSATVAHGSAANPITLSIGGTANSVAVASGASHGTATASGTSITYTPTASYSGTDAFTYTASNGFGTSAAATVTITVSNATVGYAPSSPPGGTVGVAYSQSLAGASGGTAPYTYTLATGSLPPGLTLAGNGTLSGTPTAAGSFTFSVAATDSSTGTGPFSATSGALTLAIAAPTITVNPSTLTAATVGAASNQTITASGGTSAYTYAVTSGSLPAGLSLSSGGVLSGTPTAGGSFTFTVTATDSSGAPGPYMGSRSYTLAVNAPTIAMAPASLTAIAAGATVSGAITASGGTSAYTYAVTAGSLPPGVALGAGGALSGAATSTGTFNFTVTATDSSTGTGSPYTGSRAYTWAINPPVLALSPASGNLSGSALTAYSQAFTASGGTAPYSYGITVNSGAMPAGLSFSNGTLSGMPTAAGTVNFTVTATDSTAGGPFSVPGTYSLAIGAPVVTVAPTTLPAPVIGTAYSQTMSGSGGSAPYSYAVSAGALPAGLTLAGGTISGTPTAAGAYSFTIQATDAHSFSGSQAYSGTIASPVIAVAPATLPGATKGTAYSQTVSGSGGTAPYSFAVTAGALPAGLTLNGATGAITGTPTTVSPYNFTVTATDSTTGTGAPFTASRAYSVTVAASSNADLSALALSSGTLSPVFAGGTTSYTAQVANGVGSITATPTVADAGATVTVNGNTVASGSASPSMALNVGSNAVSVAVTAASGATKTYLVTVTRAGLQTASGAGVTLDISNSSPSCTLTSSQFTSVSALPAPERQALPTGYSYPQPAVDFAAGQCTANSDLTVTLTYPNPVPANAVMMKYNPANTPPWQRFTPDSISGNQVTYTIHDNGPLDLDPAPGRFADPVILGVPASASIPTLDRWGLALLALLVGALGWARWRRDAF